MTTENKGAVMNENGRAEVTTVRGAVSLIQYSPTEITLIKRICANGATDDEFKLLMHLSKEYRLNLLAKQIWCLKIWNDKPALIFVGRDGYLDIAHQSGKFNGMETNIVKIDEGFTVEYMATEWIEGQKKRVKKIWNPQFQYVAECKVYRKDMDHPIIVKVYEEEYSTGRDNWEVKRRTMIGKVAESQALRKAFSISGTVSPEEMDKARQMVTPDYTVEEELKLPSRAQLNKDLSTIQTRLDFDAYQAKLIETYGPEVMNAPSGHKTKPEEKVGSLFKIHEDRIEGNSPVTGLKPWIDRVQECDSEEVYHILRDEYDNNANLQTHDNETLIIDLKNSLKIKENV